MGFEKPLTGAERVAKRRAVLRAQGLRPRTFWLADADSEAFKERARLDREKSWRNQAEDEQSIAFLEALADDLLDDHLY